MSFAGIESEAAREKAIKILNLVGLGHRVLHKPAELSGGQQQRVAIARALANSPEIVLADEPTANLDPAATKAIENIVQAVSASGVKVVMATHDLGEAKRLAGDIVFLHRGGVIESGPAGTFFAAPTTDDARRFLAGELLI